MKHVPVYYAVCRVPGREFAYRLFSKRELKRTLRHADTVLALESEYDEVRRICHEHIANGKTYRPGWGWVEKES